MAKLIYASNMSLDGWTEDEREEIWSAQKRDVPTFADYEVKAAGRTIPVIVLERR